MVSVIEGPKHRCSDTLPLSDSTIHGLQHSARAYEALSLWPMSFSQLLEDSLLLPEGILSVAQDEPFLKQHA
jgi:hypothetical protein